MSTHSKTILYFTPASRVVEFGSRTFAADVGLLMCKISNVTVDHVRRHTITDHLRIVKRPSEQIAMRKADTDAGITPKGRPCLL